jgi:[ribosomal protein S5]-alanine N-acetyltransferase
MKFTPFPQLKTERLVLRQLLEIDKEEIFLLRSDNSVNHYLDRKKQVNVNEAVDFISNINQGISENKWIYWAINQNNNTNLIGTICLWNFSEDLATAEIGYELVPTYQGYGIMNDALQTVLEFGFKKLKLQSIQAYTHKDNQKSTDLLLENCFKSTGKFDKHNPDNVIFELSTNTRTK